MSRKRPRPRAPRGESTTKWIPRAEWSAALLLTLLALVLHGSFFAHAGPLWRDEVNTAEFAAMPSIAAIQSSLQYDSFPILPTLALRAWMALGGTSDAGVRVFGLLLGIVFLGSLWLAARLLGARTPLISLALVALNPWVIRSVDSIRPYGLGMVFITLTVAALWRGVQSVGTRWLLLSGALAVLGVQCLYQNAFLLAAICLAATLASLRGFSAKRMIRIGVIGAAAAVSLPMYLPSIAKAREWGEILLTRPRLMELLRHIPDTTGAAGVIQSWLWLAVLALSAIVGVRALMARTKVRTAEPSLPLYASSLILIGGVVFVAAVHAAKVATQPWYYAPLLAALAPAVEVAVRAATPGRMPRLAALGVALVAAGMAAPVALGMMNERRTNADEVAAYLEQHASPGDAIVVYPFYLGVSFQRYYEGRVAWTTIPPVSEIRIHRYDLFKEAMTHRDPVDPVLATMGRSLQSGHRIWIVGGLQTPRMDQPPPSIAPAPDPRTGWWWDPYNQVWGEQAAYFLSSHATQFDTAPDFGASQVSPYERVKLLVVSGWK